MANEHVEHSPRRDALLIQAWVGEELEVSHSDFVLKGPRNDGTITFDTFACLYAAAPQYRVLSVTKQHPQDVLRTLLRCHLPSRVDQMFSRSLTRGSRRITTNEAWTMSENFSRRFGIPLGMIAFGHTPNGHTCRTLHTQPTASPVRVLQWLQRYAAQN